MKFLAEDDQLVVTLQGWEVFFGFRRKLVIPRANIVDLDWQPDFMNELQLWRIGGSAIPGVLYGGYFRNSGHNYYLYIQRPRGPIFKRNFRAQNVLTIKTQSYKYEQILLTCASDVAADLLNWWKQTTKAQ